MPFVWNIGKLKVKGPVVLGPMSGFTSNGYREFMKPFGSSVLFTEMVSDNGIIHDHKKTVAYIDFKRNRPTGLQIFGSNPDNLALASQMALERNPNIDFIDVNMGCPVYKIIKNGAGSALMKDPVKCGTIISKLKDAVDVPVTAKVRLGWDSNHINFRDVMENLVSGGADMISLHVRTMEERYSGNPHYDLVENIQDDFPVPIVISGNIYTLKDAIFAMETTKAKGVMVARGGIGNPFLLTQIDSYFAKGKTLDNPTIGQQMEWCRELTKMLIEEKGEEVAVRKLRSIAPKFVAGCKRCREFRKRIATESKDLDALMGILSEIESKMGDVRIG